MHKHLYFICPSDFLEPVINHAFQRVNYFVTSLGNSIGFDSKRMLELSTWVQTKKITHAYFVLSANNQIVADALAKQEFSFISGLSQLYHDISHQHNQSTKVWHSKDTQFLLLSYLLNQKISEWNQGWGDLGLQAIPTIGKVFYPDSNLFREVYSDLICQEAIFCN